MDSARSKDAEATPPIESQHSENSTFDRDDKQAGEGGVSNEAQLCSTSSGYFSLGEVNTAESPASSSDARSGEVSNEARLFLTSAGYFSRGEVNIAETPASPSDTLFDTILLSMAPDLNVIEGATCMATSELFDDSDDNNDDEAAEGACSRACDEGPTFKLEELESAPVVQDVPATAVCALLNIQEMVDIQRLLTQYGQCSYYILANDTLVLHLEDTKALDYADTIKESLTNIVSRRKKHKAVEIVLSNNPCKSVLCSIGDTLFVNETKQTIGMYIDHGGLVYWVSTAHGLLPVEQWSSVSYLCEKTEKMHLAEHETSQVYLTTGCTANLIRAPTPYACLGYNPVAGKNGKLLLHYVDVMIGPMPTITSHVVSGSHISASSLHEVRECPQCPSGTCCNPAHDQIVRQYAISEIWMLDRKLEGDFESYDASELMSKKLQCRPQGQEIIAGEVISYQNQYCTRRQKSEKQHPFNLHNVLVIKPTGRVQPTKGHSGSVWVHKDTKRAVAITVGKGEVYDKITVPMKPVKVWFAALLCATFDAFCAAHPNLFHDPQTIKPIVPLPSPTVNPVVSPTSPDVRITVPSGLPSSSSTTADSGSKVHRKRQI